MKILITGGLGFIGTNLTLQLLRAGNEVRILDNLSNISTFWGNHKKQFSNIDRSSLTTVGVDIDGHLYNFEIIIGDISTINTVDLAVKDMNAVIHLAARTNVVESMKYPRDVWEVNLNGTLNMLEACMSMAIKQFIFASSNAAIGDQIPPIRETILPAPISVYGASKLMGETACEIYGKCYGMNTIILRFANCYGPYGWHKENVISSFLQASYNSIKLTIFGDGKQTRDFVHVGDICQAISKILLRSSNDQRNISSLFQIASGQETSILQLADLIDDVSGKKNIRSFKPMREGEILRNYSDISRSEKELQYYPMVNLRDGIKELWEELSLKLGK